MSFFFCPAGVLVTIVGETLDLTISESLIFLLFSITFIQKLTRSQLPVFVFVFVLWTVSNPFLEIIQCYFECVGNWLCLYFKIIKDDTKNEKCKLGPQQLLYHATCAGEKDSLSRPSDVHFQCSFKCNGTTWMVHSHVSDIRYQSNASTFSLTMQVLSCSAVITGCQTSAIVWFHRYIMSLIILFKVILACIIVY